MITKKESRTQGALSLPTPEAIFRGDGVLSKRLPTYEPRAGQIAYAKSVEQAIRDEQHLAVEGGTGTGKTFGYLAVAIRHALQTGRPVIISTRTKLLQDQLASKDLPFLQTIFPGFRFAVVKGKQNYVCQHAYQRLKGEANRQEALFQTDEEASQWPKVMAWVETEEVSGGVAELEASGLAISGPLASKLTVSSADCLGRDCPWINRCFAERVKDLAQQAHIVVTNHHVSLFDAEVRRLTNGTVALLPDADVIVIDEAHTLEDVASEAFTRTVTRGRYIWIVNEFKRLTKTTPVPNTASELLAMRDDDDDPPMDVYQALYTAKDLAEELFDRWSQAFGNRSWIPIPEEAEKLLDATHRMASTLADVHEGAKRTLKSVEQLETLKLWQRLDTASRHLLRDLEAAVDDSDDDRVARFVTRGSGKSVELKVAPIDVAPLLAERLWARYQVIATSATLTTGGTFDYWRERTGAPESISTFVAPSPFDFQRQARRFLPSPIKQFVPPRNQDAEESRTYEDRKAAVIVDLLHASQGRALVLCTSKQALQHRASYARERLPYRILVQYEHPQAKLLDMFRDDVESVLFATRGFWSGIDIAGDSLSLLIIDKLPFLSPDDPLFSARCQAIDRHEGARASFGKLQMPLMVMELRQGMGRLIRRTSDTGVIAVLDGRMMTSNYANYIQKSLPKMRLVQDTMDVRAFLQMKGGRP